MNIIYFIGIFIIVPHMWSAAVENPGIDEDEKTALIRALNVTFEDPNCKADDMYRPVYELACFNHSQGKHLEAAHILETFLKFIECKSGILNENNQLKACELLSASYLSLADYKKATPHLTAALQIPGCAGLQRKVMLYQLGEAELRMSNYKGAMENFISAIQITVSEDFIVNLALTSSLDLSMGEARCKAQQLVSPVIATDTESYMLEDALEAIRMYEEFKAPLNQSNQPIDHTSYSSIFLSKLCHLLRSHEASAG